MIAVADDPLLGFALPADDPTPYARAADSLVAAADRVGVLLRRVAAMLPVRAWSGVASVAADRDLGATGLALARERTRLLGGADALVRFTGRVALASELSAEARRLVIAARDAQQQSDLRGPTAAGARPMGWGGHRADGGLYDPAAVGLLDRARLRAHEARSTYDAAARRLTADLTELSGRRAVRAGLSPRLLLDVVGLVPVVGDAVDLGNAAAYALQGRWGDASLTAVAAVPGPEGWAAASAKLGRALGRRARSRRSSTTSRRTCGSPRCSHRCSADADARPGCCPTTRRWSRCTDRSSCRSEPLGSGPGRCARSTSRRWQEGARSRSVPQ